MRTILVLASTILLCAVTSWCNEIHTYKSVYHVDAGASYTILCLNPPNTSISLSQVQLVRWYSLNNSVASPIHSELNASTTQPNVSVKNGSLVFASMMESDTGVYLCDAFSKSENTSITPLYRHEAQVVIVVPPQPPDNVRLVASQEKTLEAHWNYPFPGSTPLQAYELRLRESSNDNEMTYLRNVSHPENNFTFVDLQPYRSYVLEMRAFNELRASRISDPVTEVTLADRPKDTFTPTINWVSSTTEATLTFSCPCLSEARNPGGGDLKGPFRGFRIRVEKDNTPVWQHEYLSNTSDTYVVKLVNLEPITEYWVFAEVFNGAHYGASVPLRFKTKSEIPPPPSEPKISGETSTSFLVEWSGPSLESYRGIILHYVVDVFSKPPISTDSPRVYHWTVPASLNKWKVHTNLTSDTKYWVRLAACADSACSNFTTLVEADTATGPPATPTLISPIITSSSAITVNWTGSRLLEKQSGTHSLLFKICWILTARNKSQPHNNYNLLTESESCVSCPNIAELCHSDISNVYHWVVVPWKWISDYTKRDDAAQLMQTAGNELNWSLDFFVYSVVKRHNCSTNQEECELMSGPSSIKQLSLNTDMIGDLKKSGGFRPRLPVTTRPMGVMDSTTVVICIIVGAMVLLGLFAGVLLVLWRVPTFHACIWGATSSAAGAHRAFLGSNHGYATIEGMDGSLANGSTGRRGNGMAFSNRNSSADTASGHHRNGFANDGPPPRMLAFHETKQVAIPVENLGKHVAAMHANDDAGYQAEFEAISHAVRQDWPITVAHQPENVRKNRYSNVLAYDHTRVPLQNVLSRGKTDYINANFIDGFHRPRAFIATQGPLESTCDDFWQMIWEQHSNVIVMISNFMERGRRKCDMYWSPTLDEARSYGGVTVKLQQQIEFAYYTLRVFHIRATHRLLHHGKKSEKERTVYHYQYTDWQDFDVPRSPLPVLAFISHTLQHWNDQCGPIVVHCSAGVGRTGTYICVEAMIRQMLTENRVNVCGFLHHIRQQRMKLVQTEQQYAFIHDALREYLMCSNHEMSLDRFPSYVASLFEEASCGTTELEKQYELCVENRPLPFHYTESRKMCNTKKNRSAIWPVDHCRVNLPGELGVDGSNYINASHIQGFYRGSGYIITQHPLAHTEEDFWRMVWDENSPLILIFSSAEMPVFWPDEESESKEVGWLRVTWRGRIPLSELNSTTEESSGNNSKCAESPDGGGNETQLVCHEFLITSAREDYALVTRLCHLSPLWPVAASTTSAATLTTSLSNLESSQLEEVNSNTSANPLMPVPVETCCNKLALLQLIRGLLPPLPSVAGSSSIYDTVPAESSSHNRVLASVRRATSHLPSSGHDTTATSNSNLTSMPTPVSSGSPTSPEMVAMGSLAMLAQNLLASSECYNVVLVDDFGGSRCGSFCALSILMQQIQRHATVDVYLVVKMLHLQRPGLFQSYNELGFIYQMLELYLSRFPSASVTPLLSSPGHHSHPHPQSATGSSSANVTFRRSHQRPAPGPHQRASAMEHTLPSANMYLSLPRRIHSFMSSEEDSNKLPPSTGMQRESTELENFALRSNLGAPDASSNLTESRDPGRLMTTSLYYPRATEPGLYERHAPCVTPPPCSHSSLKECSSANPLQMCSTAAAEEVGMVRLHGPTVRRQSLHDDNARSSIVYSSDSETEPVVVV